MKKATAIFAKEQFSRRAKQTFDESRQRYGAVKICRILNQDGISCSLKRVRRRIDVSKY